MRDEAANQLTEFMESKKKADKLRSEHGAAVDNLTTVLTAGCKGPVLLQDINFLQHLTHFNRERIPERVAHAKGAGAKGVFEVTADISKYTKAVIFSKVGKCTDVAVRFSTVGGELGSADTVRDPRGFAVKFYSEDGIFDLVGNNTPVFFIRDPMLFPSLVHSQKRNPVTNLKDPDMFWDFLTLRPESMHQVMITFSDRGIPDGFRHMNGYGSHAFKLVNKDEKEFYAKFHFKPSAGIKNLTSEKAAKIAANDPDYSTRDLYNAIKRGENPCWNLSIQVMTADQAKECKSAFDLTKTWSHKEFPLIEVGNLILNQNPQNYFSDVEQLAFSPGNMIPGIEPSPDKVLQARLFLYTDAHRYRLGANHFQLPINCPYRSKNANYLRDGMSILDNQNGAPNYFPNSFCGPMEEPEACVHPYPLKGDIGRFDEEANDDDFIQPCQFWTKVLKDDEKERLVKNLVESLKDVSEFIQERAIKIFCKIAEDLGDKVTAGLEAAKKKKNSKC